MGKEKTLREDKKGARLSNTAAADVFVEGSEGGRGGNVADDVREEPLLALQWVLRRRAAHVGRLLGLRQEAADTALGAFLRCVAVSMDVVVDAVPSFLSFAALPS